MRRAYLDCSTCTCLCLVQKTLHTGQLYLSCKATLLPVLYLVLYNTLLDQLVMSTTQHGNLAYMESNTPVGAQNALEPVTLLSWLQARLVLEHTPALLSSDGTFSSFHVILLSQERLAKTLT